MQREEISNLYEQMDMCPLTEERFARLIQRLEAIRPLKYTLDELVKKRIQNVRESRDGMPIEGREIINSKKDLISLLGLSKDTFYKYYMIDSFDDKAYGNVDFTVICRIIRILNLDSDDAEELIASAFPASEIEKIKWLTNDKVELLIRILRFPYKYKYE